MKFPYVQGGLNIVEWKSAKYLIGWLIFAYQINQFFYYCNILLLLFLLQNKKFDCVCYFDQVLKLMHTYIIHTNLNNNVMVLLILKSASSKKLILVYFCEPPETLCNSYSKSHVKVII